MLSCINMSANMKNCIEEMHYDNVEILKCAHELIEDGKILYKNHNFANIDSLLQDAKDYEVQIYQAYICYVNHCNGSPCAKCIAEFCWNRVKEYEKLFSESINDIHCSMQKLELSNESQHNKKRSYECKLNNLYMKRTKVDNLDE